MSSGTVLSAEDAPAPPRGEVARARVDRSVIT